MLCYFFVVEPFYISNFCFFNENWVQRQRQCSFNISKHRFSFKDIRLFHLLLPKIQQTKILVRRQIFGDLFLFGLVWQYSSIQKNIMKVGSKPWLLTCISNITLSLPSLYFSESKRELNFCNGYLSLLYFWS